MLLWAERFLSEDAGDQHMKKRQQWQRRYRSFSEPCPGLLLMALCGEHSFCIYDIASHFVELRSAYTV